VDTKKKPLEIQIEKARENLKGTLMEISRQKSWDYLEWISRNRPNNPGTLTHTKMEMDWTTSEAKRSQCNAQFLVFLFPLIFSVELFSISCFVASF
jgi:hypothetical protein